MSTGNETRTAESELEKAAALHRGLGVVSIVFMVVAAVAPLGATTVVLPTVFAMSGNASAPVYFIGATVLLCVFSVGFTLMGRHVKDAGAFYTYVQAGLGKFAGAGAATLALISYLALLIALYSYLGVAASAALDSYLGLSVSWWLLSFAGAAIVGLLGYRDVDLSAKVLGVVLVLELILILTIDLAIVFQGGHDGLTLAPLNPSHALDGAPGLGLIFAFFAFTGFEATAVFRSEADEPDRTIPRATYLAVFLMGALYGFTAWAQAVGVGSDQVAAVAGADPANLMINLSSGYVGATFQDAVQILLVTSIFACALSFHNVVARYQFSLANGGLLPEALGRVHPRHRAPSRSSLTVSLVGGMILAATMIGGLDPVTQVYTWFSGSATLGIIVLMAVTSFAVIVFHWRNDSDDPVWNATIAPVIAMFGLAAVVVMVVANLPLLVGSQAAAVAVCAAIVGCLVAGMVVGAVAERRRTAVP